jgi:hypothetical protein
MLAPDVRHQPALLIPPILGRRGPFRPGEEIPVTLPLRNQRGAVQRDVTVSFEGVGVSFDPSEITIREIAAHTSASLKTKATVLPLNGVREIRVWANVAANDGTLQTQAATAQISARSRLRLTAEGDEHTTELVVRNEGDAPTTARLVLDTPSYPSGDLAFTQDHERWLSEEIALAPGAEQTFLLGGGRCGVILIASTDGERDAIRPRERNSQRLLMAEPMFVLNPPPSGARHGDLIPFALTIGNIGEIPLVDLQLNLESREGIEIAEESISIDDVRLLPTDITYGFVATEMTFHHHAIQIAAGIVEPGATSTLRGLLRVRITDPRDIDALPVIGSITGRNLPTFRIDAEIPIDHRPAFARGTTFLGPLEYDGDVFTVAATVTNPETHPIERLRVQWDIAEAKVVGSAIKDGDQEVPLRPTALDDRAALFTDLGTLAPLARTTVMLRLRPHRSDSDQRIMRVRATLLAASERVTLGEVERRVPADANLGASQIEILDHAPLRLGLPIEAKLMLRNDGDGPARDVRVALDLPDYLRCNLPAATDGSRWRTVAPSLPPGSALSTTIIFELTAPPPHEEIVIPVSIDAEGCTAVALPSIHFATPSDPLVDPPEIQVSPLENGQLVFLARVINRGDGIARDLSVRTTDSELIVLRSTEVDGYLLDDIGPRSALVDGLTIGDLPPAAFRDITWVVAPLSETAYRTRVFVRDHTGREVEAQSIPCRPRFEQNLAKALPGPRRLDNRTTLERSIRRPTVSRVDEPSLPSTDRVALNPAISEPTNALPPPQAAPDTATDTAGNASTPGTATHDADHSHAEQSVAQPDGHDASAQIQPETALTDATPLRTDETTNEVEIVPPPPEPAIDRDPPLDIAPNPPAGEPAAQAQAAADPVTTDAHQPTAPDHTGEADAATPPEIPFVAPAPDERPGDQQTAFSTTLVADPNDPKLAWRIEFVRALTSVVGIGWWRHVLAARALIAPTITGSSEACEAYAELYHAFEEPLRNIYPTLYSDPLHANTEWVAKLSASDDLARNALNRFLALTHLPVSEGQGAMFLDTAMPQLLPDEFGIASETMANYKRELRRIFGYSTIAQMDEGARIARYGGSPHVTLDSMLEEIVREVDAQ